MFRYCCIAAMATNWLQSIKMLWRLRANCPLHPDFKLLAGAGHFVFMAPCNDEQIVNTPGLCTDADGVDREGIHRDLISEAGRFFSRTLGITQPAQVCKPLDQ